MINNFLKILLLFIVTQKSFGLTIENSNYKLGENLYTNLSLITSESSEILKLSNFTMINPTTKLATKFIGKLEVNSTPRKSTLEIHLYDDNEDFHFKTDMTTTSKNKFLKKITGFVSTRILPTNTTTATLKYSLKQRSIHLTENSLTKMLISKMIKSITFSNNEVSISINDKTSTKQNLVDTLLKNITNPPLNITAKIIISGTKDVVINNISVKMKQQPNLIQK